MRSKFLLLALIFAASCSYSDYDPSLESYPSLAPTHINSDRYLFSYKDSFGAAKSVKLIGNFMVNGKRVSEMDMTDKNGDGVFRCAISLDPGTYYYKFLVNNRLLCSPDSSAPLARGMGNAGQAIIPNRDAPYIAALHPNDESNVTTLTGISFQIKGNIRLLGSSGPRIEVNGKHVKSSFDPSTGKGFAPISNPNEGQYILKISGQDDNSNDILEYQTIFFHYKKWRTKMADNGLLGGTAYRVLVPWFGPQEQKGKSKLNQLVEKIDYLNNGKKDGSSLGIKLLIIHSLLPAEDTYGWETTSYERFNYKIANSATFQKLASLCRQRGIKLLMYYNIAYTSNIHPFFQAAYGNPASKKCEWYFFKNDQMTKYLASGNNTARPRLNISNEYAAIYFMNNLFTWIKLGIGGFFFENIDQSPDSWWHKVHNTIRKYRKDIQLATSSYGSPQYINQLFQSKFNIVTQANYPEQLALAFSARPEALATINQQFAMAIPQGASYLRPISQTEGLRLATLVKNPMRAKAAIGFTLTSGGVPVLNWGDELGLRSTPAPLQHEPPAMPWAQLPIQKNTPYSTYNFTKKLIRLRQLYPELHHDNYGGKKVLRWADNNDKQYACFIRRISAKRFFLGVMLFSNKIKTISPEFSKTALANGKFQGKELLSFSTKAITAVSKKGELEDIEITTKGQPFLLFKFDLK